MDLFRNLFGNKPWYQSLTAWGLVVWVGLTAVVGAVCNGGLISVDLCASVQSWTTGLGSVLTVLGIRKAATSANVRSG